LHQADEIALVPAVADCHRAVDGSEPAGLACRISQDAFARLADPSGELAELKSQVLALLGSEDPVELAIEKVALVAQLLLQQRAHPTPCRHLDALVHRRLVPACPRLLLALAGRILVLVESIEPHIQGRDTAFFATIRRSQAPRLVQLILVEA